ncbi:MAG: hypothetical protein M3131_07020 [Actinomycetota bacterium]|nr:hypothetical protein [Actinomycetota bacterium]
MSTSKLELVRERSHLLLGGIRLFNGLAALLVPEMTARRLGTDPDANPAPIYPLRMFGVRTVVLGAELLLGGSGTRRHSMRLAIPIHASDTLAAALGGLRGQLPRRVAVLTTGISTINTALAILGSQAPRRRWRR